MSITDAAIGLTSAQRAAASVIEREFLAAGHTAEATAAAIVNALAESGLDPAASGDSGRSIGLFQLHEKGAGAGLSVAQRKDPVTNTRTILGVVRGNYGKRFRETALVAGTGVGAIAKLAAVFSSDIERPREKALAETYRAALAYRLFPLGLSTSSSPSPVPGSTGSSSRTAWWLAAGVGSAVVLALVLHRLRRSSTRYSP